MSADATELEFAQPPSVVPPRKASTDCVLLLLCATALGLSAVLEVTPDNQRIAVRGCAHYPAPHTCMLRARFGMNCPGCGLTRSFVHLMHADWQSALATHRLGWLLFGLACLQLPYRAWRMRYPERSPREAAAATWGTYGLLFLLLGNWACDLVTGAAWR